MRRRRRRTRQRREARAARQAADRPHPGRHRAVRRAVGQPGRAPRGAEREHGDVRRPGDHSDRRRGRPRRARSHYAEIVASIACKSAGPGHARQHRRVHRDDRALPSWRSAEPTGKAIIILNPAEPPLIMRDTVFCLSRPTPTSERSRRVWPRWSTTCGVRPRLPPQAGGPVRRDSGSTSRCTLTDEGGALDAQGVSLSRSRRCGPLPARVRGQP